LGGQSGSWSRLFLSAPGPLVRRRLFFEHTGLPESFKKKSSNTFYSLKIFLNPCLIIFVCACVLSLSNDPLGKKFGEFFRAPWRAGELLGAPISWLAKKKIIFLFSQKYVDWSIWYPQIQFFLREDYSKKKCLCINRRKKK
jgi:hypothetical protein